ncbi:MAG: penicillin-binding protein 2 [Candidatus Omnitrophica bacterium]|nr:penicillin-binding protein 2 [Candidatus Omnitrophota bacterium]
MHLRLLKKITFVSFLFLTLCLAYNQIIKGPYYSQLSQNNRIKLARLPAPRGLIYDRCKRVVAGQRLMFNAALLSQEIKDVQQSLEKISPILNIPQEELLRRFRKNFSAPFIPVVVAADVPKETAILLECKESDIPGLIIQTEPLRDYRYGASLCHILGYLGSMAEDELRKFKEYGLRTKDLIGKSGVEKEFDHYLRGEAGGMQVEVDNRGCKVRVLGKRAPRKGADLYLTIDAQLQEFIDSLLEGKKGACVVMDVQSGEILSMVSEPGFDPNLFIAALNGKPAAERRIKELLNSREAVLVNRAISGVYPPGSIFKIVVAAAGLETDGISPEARLECPGSFKVGRRRFFCWNLDGHGRQNLTEAIAYSCNVFFYKLGLALGPQKIASFARKFGLGNTTGVDLPYESTGLVPSRGWKLKTYKERWYDGETANFSIGQGYLLVTPLQMAQVISAVANGGYLTRPHIVETGGQKSGGFRKRLALEKETLEIIKEGMRRVIDDEQGTGRQARISGVQWAAKTGTAQVSNRASHGWFGAFYPFDEPRFSVLVFLEYGGSGGGTPAMIAKKIIEYIIEKDVGGRT